MVAVRVRVHADYLAGGHADGLLVGVQPPVANAGPAWGFHPGDSGWIAIVAFDRWGDRLGAVLPVPLEALQYLPDETPA